jgi:triosephosphate isomerase
MKRIIIANWKSNIPDISNFKFQISNLDLEIVLAAPYPYIDKIEGFTRGSQDVSRFPNGAYTGEVTAEMLKKLDVKYCLVGHAERRKYFGETGFVIEQKINQLKNQGIIPILCVQKPEDILDTEYIMYEPFSAISTPGNFHPESVEKVLEFRKLVKGKFLYGGSLNPQNIGNYLFADGFVIGQASLDRNTFHELLCQIKT